MLIGICDDFKADRLKIQELCVQYFMGDKRKHDFIMFSSGEEVQSYCKVEEHRRIDLLFLDVEMNGMSGIELKDFIMKSAKVWRIAFVSSHVESVFDAYGTKTIGFVPKPPTTEKIGKMISITLDDLNNDVMITIDGYNREMIEIALEDILYFKANGSYTEIYTYDSIAKPWKYILSTKKIGAIEEEMVQFPIIRVHKSYMVNLENVIDIRTGISLRNCSEKLPMGRSFKEVVKRRYYEYGKFRIKKRL